MTELHHDCHDLVCNGSRNHPRGTKGITCSCRCRDHLALEQAAEIEAVWRAIEAGWDIEDRAYFQREAPRNGFKYALAQAVHHMWKRRVKEDAPFSETTTAAEQPGDVRGTEAEG